MSEQRTGGVPTIRTFADDVAAAQAQRDAAAPPPAATEAESAPTATPAPAIPQTNVPPEPAGNQVIPNTPAPTADTDDTFVNVDIPVATDDETPTEIDDAVAGGEIVQEKKDNRFRLLPALKQSVSGWAKEQVTDLTAASPQEKIEDPTKRVDTLTRATSAAALPTTDDFATVASHVASRPRVTAEDTLQVKKTNELEAPQWSSSLEAPTETVPTPSAAATAPTDAATTVAPTPAESPQPVPPSAPADTTPVPVEPTPAAVETAPAVAPVPDAAVAPTPAIEEPVTETADPTPASVPTPAPEVAAEPATEPEPAPETDRWTNTPTNVEPEPALATPTTAASPTEREYQFRATPTPAPTRDWRTWLVAGLVALAAIALGVSVSMYVFEYLREPDGILAPEVPSAITVDRTQAVVGASGETLLSNLRQAAAGAGQGITQVYPVVAIDSDTTRVATAEETLALLNLSATGSFVRNITGLTFIGSNQETTGLIMTFTSFETALGGMFRWENRIIADLGAFLGTSPTTRFVDTTSSNRDIRVAERADGTELIYTFVDRNTLLIATDRAMIAEVVNRRQ